MLIAHYAVVHAVANHTRGIAGHAAYVCNVGARLRSGEVLQGQIRQIHVVLLHGGVHVAAIEGSGHRTVVVAHNAAHKVLAVSNAGAGAADDHAGGFVHTGNAAHFGRAGHHTGEPAALNGALVLTGNAAHRAAASAGNHIAGDGQFIDERALLHIAEETHGRSVLRQRNAGNAVAAALEFAPEGGNALKIHAGQVNVLVQDHQLVLAPAVQSAVLRQAHQILCRSNVDGLLLRLIFRQSCPRQHGQQHAQAEQRRQNPLRSVFQFAHCCSPPLLFSSDASGLSFVGGSSALVTSSR